MVRQKIREKFKSILPSIKETRAARRKKKWSDGDTVIVKAHLKLVYENDRKTYLFIRYPHDQAEQYETLLRAAIPAIQFKDTTWIKASDAPDAELIAVDTYMLPHTADALVAMYKFGHSQRFDFDGDLKIRAWETSEEGKKLARMSTAASTSLIEPPKLAKPMRPFQIAGMNYMLETKYCFNADEMGLGKTVQAIATTIKAKAFPTLVIVPATLKGNWEREIAKWAPRRKRTTIVPDNTNIENIHKAFYIKKNGKRVKKHYDFVIVNYDRLERWLSILIKIQWKCVIMDESHYLANRDSGRTRACRELIRVVKPEYAFLLTGTPIKNKPRDIMSQLTVLDRLQAFGGRKHFVKEYCLEVRAEDVALGDVDVVAVKRKKHLNHIKLNNALRSLCMVRRLKSEVLQELPKKQRTTIPLELPREARITYEAIESDVIKYLQEKVLRDKSFIAKLKEMTKLEREIAIKERHASIEAKTALAETLAKIENCKQAAAMGKMQLAIKWIEDFLESGEKLIVFSTHRIIQRELLDYFAERSTVSIRGGMSKLQKDAAEYAFQNDKKVNLMVASLKAAGVGLTLTAASNVAFLELGWNPADHDQGEDRVHRMGQDDTSVNAWYLIAANTIEEEIAYLIDSKREVVGAVSDGNPMQDTAGSILGDLVETMTTPKHLRIKKAA